ncbi:hypothetical protein LguiB_005694 [Lonicera macranthoides]
MAQEKEAKDAGESSSKPISSKVGTPKPLKPKAKIVKKFPCTDPTQNNNSKGTPQVQGEKKKRRKKKKIVSEENMERRIIVREDDKKLNPSETKQKTIAYKEENDNRLLNNSKSKEKPSGFQKKQKSEKKNAKGSGFGNTRSQMYKEKRAELEKNKQKERLGGLIFMCNAKTKPDCFRYQVMGVPLSKKELVLGIKPGLKLFLFDFDLRLMYGIYKASSSGGLKLEPTAFAGAFPAQVRFVVDRDCYPVAESIFKRAIKENYDSPTKFKTDLTPKQVKKLIELFRPVDVPSNTPAIVPQQMVSVQQSYPLLPQENTHHFPYREGPSTEKEEAYLTEKDYRTYGLRRERSNLTTPPTHTAPILEPYPPRGQLTEQSLRYPPALYREIAPSPADPTPPTLEPYPRGQVTEHHMRHPSALYREIAPPQGEPTRYDPLILSEREYQTYGLGARQELQYSVPPSSRVDQHHYPSHYTTSAVDPYPPPSSRVDQHHYPSHYTTSAMDPYPPPSSRVDQHHYPSHYTTTAVDPYPPPSSRVEVSSEYYLGASGRAYPIGAADRLPRETYPVETLPRRETYLTETNYLSRRGSYVAEADSLRKRERDDSERLYSAHASSALSDYNRTHNYQAGARPESSSLTTSVSARYSFAGPSSYR